MTRRFYGFSAKDLATTRKYEPNDIGKIIKPKRATIHAANQEQGFHIQCESTIDELYHADCHAWPKIFGYIGIAVVFAIGALIFNGAAGVSTLRLPLDLQEKIAPLFGGFMALVGEDRTKRSFTAVRLIFRRSVNIKSLEQQEASSQNEFESSFVKGKIELVCTVEKLNLPYIDIIIAFVAVVIEAGAAFYLSYDAGWWEAIFNASVPLLVILTVAATLSERVDLPKELKRLCKQYQNALREEDEKDTPEDGINILPPPSSNGSSPDFLILNASKEQ